MEVVIMSEYQTGSDSRRPTWRRSRRRFITGVGAGVLTGIAGCTSGESNSQTDPPTNATTPPSDSGIEALHFTGTDLVVKLADDHDVARLNLIGPEGATFEETRVAQGATEARLQLMSKTGTAYSAGQYELIAVTEPASESMPIELQPAVQVADVRPEVDEEEGYSTGRLVVSVTNTGTGPTWVYNIGFRNAPYRNAPAVIDGDAPVDTTFAKPAPDKEFLPPETTRDFLKRRGVLVVDGNNGISCEGATAELTVVVQTPHGDVAQPVRAQLSGGVHVDDSGALQHPCQDVQVELLEEGDASA